MEVEINSYDKFRDEVIEKIFKGKSVPIKPETVDSFTGAPHLNKDVHWMDPRSRRVVPHMCLDEKENAFVASYNEQMHKNNGVFKRDWVDPNKTETDEFGNAKQPGSEDKTAEESK